MKQTAIEWLLDNIISEPYSQEDFKYNSDCWDKAKDLEKRHIMDANTTGVNCGLYGYKNAEEYYKKTFTKQTRKQNDNINVTNK
jgi:hypothetical protein